MTSAAKAADPVLALIAVIAAAVDEHCKRVVRQHTDTTVSRGALTAASPGIVVDSAAVAEKAHSEERARSMAHFTGFVAVIAGHVADQSDSSSVPQAVAVTDALTRGVRYTTNRQ